MADLKPIEINHFGDDFQAEMKPYAGKSDGNTTPSESPREYAVKSFTEEQYARTVKHIMSYSEAKQEQSGSTEWTSVTAVTLVKDIFERTDLKESTRNAYIYALKWYLTKHIDSRISQEAVTLLNELRLARRDEIKITAKLAKKHRDRVKVLPAEHAILLLKKLGEMSMPRGVWAQRAQVWLMAGLSTGLRPIEWLNADWSDEHKTHIRVLNGKVKADTPGYMRESSELKAYEPVHRYRMIPVESADITAIDEHMSCIRTAVLESSMDFVTYRNSATHALWRACSAIWNGKHNYSLYNARRQFSANQRAQFGIVVAAERLGHSRADSPARYAYGKANQAHSRTGIHYRENSTQKTDQSQVQAVGQDPSVNTNPADLE